MVSAPACGIPGGPLRTGRVWNRRQVNLLAAGFSLIQDSNRLPRAGIRDHSSCFISLQWITAPS